MLREALAQGPEEIRVGLVKSKASKICSVFVSLFFFFGLVFTCNNVLGKLEFISCIWMFDSLSQLIQEVAGQNRENIVCQYACERYGFCGLDRNAGETSVSGPRNSHCSEMMGMIMAPGMMVIPDICA